MGGYFEGFWPANFDNPDAPLTERGRNSSYGIFFYAHTPAVVQEGVSFFGGR